MTRGLILISMTGSTPNSAGDIIFIGFADNKIPEFREVRNRDWIFYGEDNKFPDHVLYLYNKSSSHGAVVNLKSTYIFGKGFPVSQPVNDAGETINTIVSKCIKDIELFGGFRLQATPTKAGKFKWAHIPFNRIRTGKDGRTFYYKKDWGKSETSADRVVHIPSFDPSQRKGAMIFAYNEYRPGVDTYPLPGYFSGLNDIETDVEISKYNLSIIKNGMFSGKMLVFRTGEPEEQKKRDIERGFKDKFAGSDNAGKFMIAYIKNGELPPEVIDLSTTDLDKLFDQLNRTIQQKIFSAHHFPPILAGIAEPGKLGQTNEIQAAYSQFRNTYANEKQQAVELVFDYLSPFMGHPPGQKIQPVEPIDVVINPVDFKDMLPKQWVLDQLGIDPEDYPEAAPAAQPGQAPASVANSHLRGLSGRESQNLDRILRKYRKGQINRAQAEMMLKSGYGMAQEEVDTFLTFEEVDKEEAVAEMFAEVGTPRANYTILKTRECSFEQFATLDQLDSDIVNLIGKDKRITPEVIAKTLHVSQDKVDARISALTESGVLKSNVERVGVDSIIERTINSENIDVREAPQTVDVYVRYSYEAKPGLKPIIETTRPFCRRLIELDRLYSRAEIESISQRVGYSVFDRKGGFWGSKDECRHRWVSNVVIRKR